MEKWTLGLSCAVGQALPAFVGVAMKEEVVVDMMGDSEGSWDPVVLETARGSRVEAVEEAGKANVGRAEPAFVEESGSCVDHRRMVVPA